jgi:restriction system protein
MRGVNKGVIEQPRVFCVRAEFGLYADAFRQGGYAAIGWIPERNLSDVQSREQLYPLYREAHPSDLSNVLVGVQVGQIARFLLEARVGDFVITPAANTELLYAGEVAGEPSYFYFEGSDGCPYRHRRRVRWLERPLKRADLSVPFQNTIRSSLTIFGISQRNEFFEAIERKDLVERRTAATYDAERVVLEQILELHEKEFELLVTHLLAAMGFEGTEHTGKTGDGGVDATGELNVFNLAKVKVFVQAKRYKLGARISAGKVKNLRQAIPFGGQGAFITTADYHEAAKQVALEPGFPRIGLINGRQLVDLLVQHWDSIPVEFRERLGLRPGLVRV